MPSIPHGYFEARNALFCTPFNGQRDPQSINGYTVAAPLAGVPREGSLVPDMAIVPCQGTGGCGLAVSGRGPGQVGCPRGYPFGRVGLGHAPCQDPLARLTRELGPSYAQPAPGTSFTTGASGHRTAGSGHRVGGRVAGSMPPSKNT